MGSSVKKLCEEVGKKFKPRLGRTGRASSVLKEATESRPQSHEAGREAGFMAGLEAALEAGEASIYRLNLKVTRQAVEAGLEAGVEASLRSLKARSLSLSARLKSLEAGLGGKLPAWLAGRTKAYK